MIFKVWRVLAVVALVFVLTATAINPDRAYANKMNRPKEAAQSMKKPAERPSKKYYEKQAEDYDVKEYQHDRDHDVAGAQQPGVVINNYYANKMNDQKEDGTKKEAEKPVEKPVEKPAAVKPAAPSSWWGWLIHVAEVVFVAAFG